ncbi:MAG: metallophosphoesterase [archaeon]
MIGIISDTHDNVTNVKKAVEIFKKNNVEFVIHAGDVISPATVMYFAGLKMKFIFGNCDGDRHGLDERAMEIGGEHYGRVMELEYKGKTIGVIHGDNSLMYQKMLQKGYDYLIHGDTHKPEDRRVNRTRVLCPGGHYLGDPQDRKKIIILDVENDRATFLEITANRHSSLSSD